MRALAITTFKIRYIAMTKCFMKCITGVCESFHFGCYDKHPIVGFEDFKKAEKIDYLKNAE